MAVSLLFGFFYYYFFRDTVLGFYWVGIEKNFISDIWFSQYFLWFPTFIHPFLFSLLSWWGIGYKYPKTLLLFWCTANVLFEIGQGVNPTLYEEFPKILINYFYYGVFDWFDVLSIFLGTLVAYITIRFLSKEEI